MAARRDEILDAARACFEEHGYAATTIEQIAARSGASNGSIYHHFGAKEGIASALYVQILRDYQRGVARTIRRGTGAERAIKALVRHHLRWVERHPVEARFLLHSGAGVAAKDEVAAANRELYDAFDAWMVVNREALRQLPREVFFAVAIGPAHELSRGWLAGRVPSLRRLEAALAEAAWRAVRAD